MRKIRHAVTAIAIIVGSIVAVAKYSPVEPAADTIKLADIHTDKATVYPNPKGFHPSDERFVEKTGDILPPNFQF